MESFQEYPGVREVSPVLNHGGNDPNYWEMPLGKMTITGSPLKEWANCESSTWGAYMLYSVPWFLFHRINCYSWSTSWTPNFSISKWLAWTVLLHPSFHQLTRTDSSHTSAGPATLILSHLLEIAPPPPTHTTKLSRVAKWDATSLILSLCIWDYEPGIMGG